MSSESMGQKNKASGALTVRGGVEQGESPTFISIEGAAHADADVAVAHGDVVEGVVEHHLRVEVRDRRPRLGAGGGGRDSKSPNPPIKSNQVSSKKKCQEWQTGKGTRILSNLTTRR